MQGQGARISFQQVLIWPDQAAQLLATAGRAVETREHQNAVQRYAQIMAPGEWILNAQPIILDETGRLLDGVLRLNAAIAAGVSFQTLAMNVRADTLHTINQHRRRMYQGVLESRGIANAGTIVRMMSKLIRIENGHFTAPDAPISWSHYDRVLDANPALHQAAAMANGLRGSLLHSTARPVLAFMALQAGQSEALSSFFREMGPDHLLGLESPPRMLALQFQLMRDNGHPASPVQPSSAMILRAVKQCRRREEQKKSMRLDASEIMGIAGDDSPELLARIASISDQPEPAGLVTFGYLPKGSAFLPQICDPFGFGCDEKMWRQLQRIARDDEGAGGAQRDFLRFAQIKDAPALEELLEQQQKIAESEVVARLSLDINATSAVFEHLVAAAKSLSLARATEGESQSDLGSVMQ